MLTKLTTLLSALYVSTATAKANYRFPQFFKEGMTHDEIFEHERLVAINGFSEQFRGWEDEVPHFPDELKVINVTAEIYKTQVMNSNKPWIICFLKKWKSQEHLVHSEEIYMNL
jgi:hypothetical protein